MAKKDGENIEVNAKFETTLKDSLTLVFLIGLHLFKHISYIVLMTRTNTSFIQHHNSSSGMVSATEHLFLMPLSLRLMSKRSFSE